MKSRRSQSSRSPVKRLALAAAVSVLSPQVAAAQDAAPIEAGTNIVGATEEVAPAEPSAEARPAETAAEEPTPSSDSATPGEPAPQQKVLNPEAAAAYETTVVGTTLAKTAGSAHIMKSKQLERMNYDDATAVVTSVPGVYARGEDGLGLRPNIGIRGVNPDRSKKITLLEDGVPFAPAPYSAAAAYYFPLITRMTGVRVLKGPAAIAHGPHTVGGVIDLITRPIPSHTQGGVDLAGGQYGYGKGHVYFGTGTEQFGFLVEGVHLRSSGFKELPSGADTGFVRNEWMAKASYVLDPTATIRNEFKLKLTYSDEASNETYLGLSDEDFRKNPYHRYAASALDRMTNHRTSIALTHEMRASSKLSLSTSAYRHEFIRSWRKANQFRQNTPRTVPGLFDILTDPTESRSAVYYGALTGRSDGTSDSLMIGPNERNFISQGVLTRLRIDGDTGSFNHRVEAGLKLHNDIVERRHSEDGFLLQGGLLIPDRTPTTVTGYNEASTNALSAHLVDAVTWKALTVTGGLRFEAMQSTYIDKLAENRTTDNSAIALLPSLGAFYSFTEEFGVLAGAYRGFSPPAPDSGDPMKPKPKPELAINYEAGARYASGRAHAEIIGFYNDYSNLTDTCTFSSGCPDQNIDQQFDAGKARIYGFEAYFKHEVPVRTLKIPLSLAYTFTKSELLNGFKSADPIFGIVEKGYELAYLPQHQVTAAAGVEHRRAGGNVNVTYVSAMREIAGTGDLSKTMATDAQFIVDASASVKVWKSVALYANVRNLFNSAYIVSRRPYGARPNAPRWIQIGTKFDF